MNKTLPDAKLFHSLCGESLNKWTELEGIDRGHALKYLPEHLLESKKYDDNINILTDLEFLEEKIRSGQISELIADLETSYKQIPEKFNRKNFLFLISRVLKYDGEFLAAHPGSFFQCVWNRCFWYDSPLAEKYYIVPEGGWNDKNAPWKRPGDKICELMEDWRKIFESRKTGKWLKANNPPEISLTNSLAGEIKESASFIGLCPDSGNLISRSYAGFMRIWDINSLKELEGFNEETIYDRDFDFRSDYEVLGYMKNDFKEKMTRVLLWSEGAGLRIYPCPAVAAVICKENATLYYSEENKLYSRDLINKEINFICEMHKENIHVRNDKNSTYIYCIAMDYESRKIVTGANDDTLGIYDMLSSEKIEAKFSSALTQILIDPETKNIVTVHDARVFYAWNMNFGKAINEFIGHEKFVNCVVFDRGKKKIVSASNDKTIREWDPAGGNGSKLLLNCNKPVSMFLLANKDDKIITYSKDDRTIKVWFNSGDETAVKCRKKISVIRNSFKNDKYITMHPDDSLTFWNAEDGSLEFEMGWKKDSRIVSLITLECNNLLVIDEDGSKTMSLNFIDVSDHSVKYSYKLDFSYSSYKFINKLNKFYFISGASLLVFDIYEKTMLPLDIFGVGDSRDGKLFDFLTEKNRRRSPDFKNSREKPYEFLPAGDEFSGDPLLFLGRRSAFLEGASSLLRDHYDKLIVFDAVKNAVVFEHSGAGEIIKLKGIIASTNIFYYCSFKKPAVKLLDNAEMITDDMRLARGLIDSGHFLETFEYAPKEFELNFLSSTGLKVKKFKITCYCEPVSISHNGLIIVFDCQDPERKVKTSAGKYEAIVFDAKNFETQSKFSFGSPITIYNNDLPGVIVFGLETGELGILFLDGLKMTKVDLFENKIVEINYISDNIYLFTDSRGDRFIFDIENNRIINDHNHLLGNKTIIFENENTEPELITLRTKGFSHSAINESSKLIKYIGFPDADNILYQGDASYCVHNENILSVNDRSGKNVLPVNFLSLFYSKVDKELILSTGRSFTQFSDDGRYLLYMLNYELNGNDQNDRQAMIIYDLQENIFSLKYDLRFIDIAHGFIRPFHFSSKKRVCFACRRLQGGTIASFHCYDFEKDHLANIDHKFGLGFTLATTPVTTVAMDNKTKYIAAAYPSGIIEISNFKYSDTGSNSIFDPANSLPDAVELTEHYYPITSIYFTKDNKFMITRSVDNKTVKWETGTWKKVETLCDSLAIFKYKPVNVRSEYRDMAPAKVKDKYQGFDAGDSQILYFNKKNAAVNGNIEYTHVSNAGKRFAVLDNNYLKIISLEGVEKKPERRHDTVERKKRSSVKKIKVESASEDPRPVRDDKSVIPELTVGDKTHASPRGGHKESMRDIRHLPDNCAVFYTHGSFVIYKNDELKSFFISSCDYHTPDLSVDINVFSDPSLSGPAENKKKKGRPGRGADHAASTEKYYSGISWTVYFDYANSNIIFHLDDYHGKYLKLPFAEAKNIIEKFRKRN